MQLLGEGRQDKVDQAFSISTPTADLILFKLMSGAYQFGIGRDAKIVTELAEVGAFGPKIQQDVAKWLLANGPRKAMQDKVAADVHEQSMAEPGSIDARLALLDQAAPGLKGEITSLIDSILVKHGLVQAASDAPIGTGPKPAGRYRQATPEEVRIMAKAGLPLDPNNPPKVWDPEGELAGPASLLRDAPDNSEEMLSLMNKPKRVAMPSAQDLLEDEEVNQVADELAEEPV